MTVLLPFMEKRFAAVHWSLLALSGHANRAGECPLLNQSGQSLVLTIIGLSAYDP